MAAKQRHISVAEFFSKNRHLLGFDNPTRALLTCVKEAVDNALDACEEARIRPEVLVELHPASAERIRVVVEDNGPGIAKKQIPLIFGKLLYGSKFHKMSQSRGQQGIGISAAGMYGLLTTGKPVVITSRTSPRGPAHHVQIAIDTTKNEPNVRSAREVPWEGHQRGTRVEIELEARYVGGERSVDNYLKQTAIANPHVRITLCNHCRKVEGEPSETTYEPATKTLPPVLEEIQPHPHGVELGVLVKMLENTAQRQVNTFLQKDFCKVGPKTADAILEAAGIDRTAKPSRIARREADALHQAIQRTKIQAPSTDCIAAIGEDLLLAGLRKEVQADFYTAVTRPPSVYRGYPFQVEAALAFGNPEGIGLEVDAAGRIRKTKKRRDDTLVEVGAADEPIRLVRFANRVPLQFQRSACAITKTVVNGVNWKSYGVPQSRGAMPVAPMVLMVHVASVWVPFTSESKDAIASYDVIVKELKLAIQECARRLSVHIRKGKRIKAEYEKREHIEQFIPHIGEALQEILGIPDTVRTRTEAKLKDTLERSRKI